MALSLPYYQQHEFDVALRDQPLKVIAKRGMPTWDRVSPAETLLAETPEVPAGAAVLLIGTGGAVAAAISRSIGSGNSTLLDPSVVVLEMARATLARNHINNARVLDTISVLPQQAGAFQTALIAQPKSRALSRRWLVEAYTALQVGGQLYIAGANDEGIRPAIEDAGALFGGATILNYKKGCRIALATRVDPAPAPPGWAAEPGIAPGTWAEIKAEVRGKQLRLRTLPGVFAYEQLDAGTALLLANLRVPTGARVLDAGCGNGVIGIAAAQAGAAAVDLIDSDLLAVAAACENVARYAPSNARAFASDALAAVNQQRYDLVATNPPFHTGKAVDYDVARTFVEHSRMLLNPRGRLLLVANRFIRYDQLMQQVFGNVKTVTENTRFHVLESSLG